MAIAEIRDSRLYREEFETFEDYCKDRWEFTKSYANNLIAAKSVVVNLNDNNCCQIASPANEAQVRPLTQLETPEAQQEAWETVVETARKRLCGWIRR